jgi:thioredoxin-like negative regulator of GroEL
LLLLGAQSVLSYEAKKMWDFERSVPVLTLAEFMGRENKTGFSLVYIYNPWCGRSRSFFGGGEAHALSTRGDPPLYRVNADQAPSLYSRLTRRLPSLLLVDHLHANAVTPISVFGRSVQQIAARVDEVVHAIRSSSRFSPEAGGGDLLDDEVAGLATGCVVADCVVLMAPGSLAHHHDGEGLGAAFEAVARALHSERLFARTGPPPPQAGADVQAAVAVYRPGTGLLFHRGPPTVAAITAFVSSSARTRVADLNQRGLGHLSRDRHHPGARIRTAMILFLDPDDTAMPSERFLKRRLAEALLPLGDSFTGLVGNGVVLASLRRRLGVLDGSLPALVAYDPTTQRHVVSQPAGRLPANITAFAELAAAQIESRSWDPVAAVEPALWIDGAQPRRGAWLADAGGAVDVIEGPGALKTVTELWGSGGSTLLLAHTTWCGHCARMLAALEEAHLPRRTRGGLRVHRVDVQRERDVSLAFNITRVPSLLLLRGGGRAVEAFRGQPQISDILAWLRRLQPDLFVSPPGAPQAATAGGFFDRQDLSDAEFDSVRGWILAMRASIDLMKER